MFSIICLDNMKPLDDEIESLEMARDKAIEACETHFAAMFEVYNVENSISMGIAFEGRWYVNSETLTDGS